MTYYLQYLACIRLILMARTPPVKMSYPCNECNFEAQSARQLSRHKAVTHVENALKCVLCPFVTVGLNYSLSLSHS